MGRLSAWRGSEAQQIPMELCTGGAVCDGFMHATTGLQSEKSNPHIQPGQGREWKPNC